MDKDVASLRLGGEESAARWIGISVAVYRQWPARLHPVMRDRVVAAVIRRDTAKALGLNAKQFFADPRNEIFIESMIDRISLASVIANLQQTVPAEFARHQEAAASSKQRRKRNGDKTEEPAGVT
jgi:hypothetical protein